MIHSKYDVMKRCISEMNFPDYRYEQLIKMIFAQHIPDFHAMYMLPERLRANLAETFGSLCLRPCPSRTPGIEPGGQGAVSIKGWKLRRNGETCITKKDGNLFASHLNAAVGLAANSAQPVLSDTNVI
jgi:hypothetical protein